MALRADRLKDLRELRELTQEELADRSGVTLRSIQRYEAGENPKSVQIIQQLAQALDTTTLFLTGESSQADPNLVWADLTAEEQALILALRKRQASEAIQAFAALSKDI